MGDLAVSSAPSAAAPFDEARFLAEVRAFLAGALTDDLRAAGRDMIGVHADIAACRIWHRRLSERGWIAPAWPVAWGGAGWSARQRFLFDRECALNDAPVLFAGGVRSVGPLLIERGTPHQRSLYLPRILSGEDLWCQGFSEPGAGSDLAAIATRAERRGEHYVVNGSKIWTTGAHHANRMFALVRTADGARRQEGLSFLLIDMDSRGLSVAPVLGLAGDHEFNQVFFDDVRVPTANRVGEENDGWAVAKRLMQLARANNTPAALLRRVLRRAGTAVAAMDAEQAPALRRRLAGLEVELCAFEQIELSALPTGRPGAADQATPSMLKLIGSELHQRIADLTRDAVGPYAAAGWTALGRAGEAVDLGAWASAKYLAVRAATIYSGTSETQHNVIARQMLGTGGG